MVRLNSAGRDQHVGADLNRIANQELQLTSLVAAAFKAGQIIALNPQVLKAELRTKILEPM
jgi:hypothetical protein